MTPRPYTYALTPMRKCWAPMSTNVSIHVGFAHRLSIHVGFTCGEHAPLAIGPMPLKLCCAAVPGVVQDPGYRSTFLAPHCPKETWARSELLCRVLVDMRCVGLRRSDCFCSSAVLPKQ